MIRTRTPRQPAALPRRQGGAAIIYGGAAMLAGTASMALAYDVAQLYYAQRDLQRVASNAAADAARAASGCYTTGAPTPLSTADAAVNASLARNLVYAPGEGKTGRGRLAPADLRLPYADGVPTVRYGVYTQQPSRSGSTVRGFFPVTNSNDPRVDAVQVNLARLQPTPLIPFIYQGTPNSTQLLRASASAQQSPVASFSIGNRVAGIGGPAPGTNPFSLLCPLLGITPANCVALNLLNSTALASASVNLGLLAVNLGVGDTDHLLNAHFPANALLDGIATTLNQQGDAVSTAAASTFSALAATAGTADVAIADLLNNLPNGTGNQVGGLPLNAEDLLTQLALNAGHGLYPLRLNVPTNIPGVTLDAFVSLGDSPHGLQDDTSRNALGRPGLDATGTPRTSASIQQVKLSLRFGLDSSKIPALGALIGPLAMVNLGIDLTGGSASSFLQSIGCPAPISGSGPNNLKTNVVIPTMSDVATLRLGTFNPANKSAPVTGGNIIAIVGGLVSANLPSPIPLDIPLAAEDVTFHVDEVKLHLDQADYTKTVGAQKLLSSLLADLYATLGSSLVVKVGPLSAPISGAQLVTALKPTLNMVATTLDPTIALLGVNLGGTTVTLNDISFGTRSGIAAGTQNQFVNSQPVVFSKSKPLYEEDIPTMTIPDSPASR